MDSADVVNNNKLIIFHFPIELCACGKNGIAANYGKAHGAMK